MFVFIRPILEFDFYFYPIGISRIRLQLWIVPLFYYEGINSCYFFIIYLYVIHLIRAYVLYCLTILMKYPFNKQLYILN